MTRPSPRIDIAHEALKQAILERALQPGTKLPEDEIGAHFGMSRTLVRAVLAKLQSEGLVDARPKRTAIVAQPTWRRPATSSKCGARWRRRPSTSSSSAGSPVSAPSSRA